MTNDTDTTVASPVEDPNPAPPEEEASIEETKEEETKDEE